MHWCETSLLHQAVLKHVVSVSRDFILKNSLLGISLYSAKNKEIYGIVFSYLIFPMSFCITLKKKSLACTSYLDYSVGQ